MEIWRLLAFWLSRVLLTGIFPCAIAERTDEFVRAMELGFVSEEMAAAPDSAITWKQFCEMAGRIIETYDVSALPAWQEMTANALDTSMKRDGGMMSMLFVAKAVNLHNFNAGYPSVGMTDDLWVYATMDYPVFPFNTFIDLGGGVVDNNHVGPAYDYCLRRASLVSGKRLLDWDENNSLRFANDFTVRDAAQAILRLRESAITIDQRMPNEEDAALLGKVEARKQKILNAQTDISYTGTTYYVSNDGDDQKDGQSPETAWATLDKVNEAGAGNMLLPGDAVLFERGGLWRGFINCAQGVTYSAYGEGESREFMVLKRVEPGPISGNSAMMKTAYESGSSIGMYLKQAILCLMMVNHMRFAFMPISMGNNGLHLQLILSPLMWLQT